MPARGSPTPILPFHKKAEPPLDGVGKLDHWRSMRWFRTSFWSGGSRVSKRTYRQIREGDAARAASDWPLAAEHYGRAVSLQPNLFHIHVQLGHALKESGRWDLAEDAYDTASRLRPNDREAWLYLAQVARSVNAPERAARHYLQMLRIDVEDVEAAAELAATLRRLSASARQELVAELRCLLHTLLGSSTSDAPAGLAGATLVFDVSDLIMFFRHQSRPTGIQRVQLEIVNAALDLQEYHGRVAICCMSEESDEWRELPSATFRALVSAAVSIETDALTWRRLQSSLRLTLLITQPVGFGNGTVLISLGASWCFGNYFLALRNIQALRAIAYLPFVHDLIPVVHPEWHVSALVAEFSNWLAMAMEHASGFLVNSQATRRDLVQVATLTDQPLANRNVAVIPLGAGIRAPDRLVARPEEAPLRSPYVLMVGTVEARKGHLTALAAWQILLAQGPAPHLVWVGRRGWNNDAVFAKLASDDLLASHVELLSDIDDAALAALYDGAMFTLYPSLYEGWGLPVTEALCRGKVVITTTASSLPEAGGEFAVYIPPDDPAALAAAVDELVTDGRRLRRMENAIERDFRPRSWPEIAAQVLERATRLEVTGNPPARRVAPNRFYTLGRISRLMPPLPVQSGEAVRVGCGWHWPEDWGCRIRDAEGGQLLFTVEAPLERKEEIGIEVLLRGTAAARWSWRLTTGSGAESVGTLHPSQRTWVSTTCRPAADGTCMLTIVGEAVEMPPAAKVSGSTRDGLGVEGFFVTLETHPVDFEALRRRRLEHASSNDRSIASEAI